MTEAMLEFVWCGLLLACIAVFVKAAGVLSKWIRKRIH